MSASSSRSTTPNSAVTSSSRKSADLTESSEAPLAVDDARGVLASILVVEDPSDGLRWFVDSGLAESLLPELPALRLEQDPIHRHKDVLTHTIAVVAQTRPDLRLRLSALFHDVGKPRTRSFEHGGVTFRHHEAVGAKMTKRRMRELGFDDELVADVAELVRLSGRFKGYADGWSDSAVRRYARDAGHLLGTLNELVRADCTTRNAQKRLELQHHVDELETRISALDEEERRAAERPLLDGAAVMTRLGLAPGRAVGEALKFLLELKRSEPELDVAATERRLDDWWAQRRQAPGA